MMTPSLYDFWALFSPIYYRASQHNASAFPPARHAFELYRLRFDENTNAMTTAAGFVMGEEQISAISGLPPLNISAPVSIDATRYGRRIILRRKKVPALLRERRCHDAGVATDVYVTSPK